MKNYSLLEMRNVTLENNEEVSLKYYLVNKKKEDTKDECINGENEFLNKEDDVYGIKLVKENSKFKDMTIEEDEVSGITSSEKAARDLLAMLANNTVTPVSLSEVVDDWTTKYLCV